MKILVIGQGGREHALIWKLAQDGCRPDLYCAPGNGGTAGLATNLNIAATDIAGLSRWAKVERPDLVIVGPEAPLCAGITDVLSGEGVKVFGPSRVAAQLEGSKIFAKDVLRSAGVPTAKAEFFTEAAKAKAFVRNIGVPLVIKADGLAAGKGVSICTSIAEADKAISDYLEERLFGAAGERILVEEMLVGPEVSVLALVDGEHFELMATAQDHKRVADGDEGPNTGGMGAYSPTPVLPTNMLPLIKESIFKRTLDELCRRGIDYRGVLYAGLMMTREGPKVLEFNCRFGDPETQVILPRWRGDIVPVLMACADGELTEDMVSWSRQECLCVVMAAGGYPGSFQKGDLVTGLDKALMMPNTMVFHAGTARTKDGVITAGGRVLAVSSWGDSLKMAADRAYQAVKEISFRGAHYRTDIGAKYLSYAPRI